MKQVKILAALATTAVLGFAVVAHAHDDNGCDQEQTHPHHRGVDGDKGEEDFGGRDFERRPVRFDKILDLSDAQKKTLKTSRAEQNANRQTLHEKVRGAREALNEAADANSDDATINKLSNELASLIAQQEVVRIKARKQFLSVLTSEQKQKLDAFEAERKDSRQEKQKRQDSTQAK
jgi:Spy/CpxP family protein refolding chaperone